MRNRGRATAVIAACLLLSGCVPVAHYPGNDEGSEESKRQLVLSLTWENLRLVGLEKPDPNMIPLDEDDDWRKLFTECASASVPSDFAYSYSAEAGYSFEEYGTATRLAIYTCLASLPLDPAVQADVLSQEQLQFIYDYHQQTLVPCLESQGMSVSDVPTGEQFLATGGQWSPFTSLYLVSASDWRRYEVAYTRCTADPLSRALVASR